MSAVIREIQKNTARERSNSQAHTAPPYSGDCNSSKNDEPDLHPLLRFWNNHSRVLINIFSVMAFYGVGIAWYYHHEDWTVLDCVYFITVSCYGDFSPSDDSSRLFTIFFVLVGLVFIFSIINDFAQSILRYAEKKALEKLDDDPTDLKEPHGAKIVISVLMIMACVLLGTLFFKYNENWSFVEALYWSFITTVTVGYGDMSLKYDSSRIFSIFYIIVSVIVVASAIGNFGAVQIEIAQEKRKLEMLSKELDLDAIIAMDVDGGGVDRVEFLTAMLVQMNGLNKEKDIDPWLKRFEELDADGSGALDAEDLRLFAEQEELRKSEALARFTGGNPNGLMVREITPSSVRAGEPALTHIADSQL